MPFFNSKSYVGKNMVFAKRKLERFLHKNAEQNERKSLCVYFTEVNKGSIFKNRGKRK